MPLSPYEWDDEKASRNLEKHGVPFETIYAFDWGTARRWMDDRYDYGEERRVALGVVGTRHYVVVYTVRESQIRLISMRKANRREQP